MGQLLHRELVAVDGPEDPHPERSGRPALTPRGLRALVGTGLAVIAALVVTAPAQATDPASQFDQPAPSQYIETLPGSGGPTAPAVGGSNRGRAAPLSA